MSFANEIWLAIRTGIADQSGSGTPTDPYAANTQESFGNLMRLNAPSGRLIRLGPGIFRTRGGGGNGVVGVDSANLFRALPGQKIIGSGMFATTVRFVWDQGNVAPTGTPGQRHNMILGSEVSGSEFLSSFELSDLTLDLGLDKTPFYPDPKTIEDTQGLTATVSGAIVTASSAIFTAAMVTKIVYLPHPSNPLLDFYARISSVASGGPWMTATIDRSDTISTPRSFWIYGVRFTVTGVSVVGDNVLLKRVRIINFGTRTPYYFDGKTQAQLGPTGGPNRTLEGFPSRIEGRTGTRAAFNSVQESCIFEQPFCGPGREVTCAVLGGGVSRAPNSSTSRLHLQPFGSVIRNCYMNFDYTNPRPGTPVKVTLSTYSSIEGKVTVTTEFPADLSVGDFVEIYGSNANGLNGRWPVNEVLDADPTSKLVLGFKVVLDSSAGGANSGFAFKSPAQTMPAGLTATAGSKTVTVSTATKHYRQENDWICISGCEADEFNGTFKVTWVAGDGLSLQYLLYANASTSTPGGQPWLDRRPSLYIKISGASIYTTPSMIGKITTAGPHYRKPGDWIGIGAVAAGSPATTNNGYNNYLQILSYQEPDVDTRTTFYVQLYSLLNTTPFASGGSVDPSFVGGFQAVSANGGVGGGAFSNRIANCIRSGTYHDFWWETQAIARRNYYHNVFTGQLMVFGISSTYGDAEPKVADAFGTGSLTVTAGSNVVRFQLTDTTADPGYVLGLAIQIVQGAVKVDGEITNFRSKGDFDITLLTISGLTVGTASASAYLWFQQSLYLFEDNILDLAMETAGGTTTPPVAISFRGPYWDTPPPLRGLNDGAKFPWLLQDAIIRDNHIRKIGGLVDPGGHLTLAISFDCCRNTIAEGNIFPLMNPANAADPQNIFRYSNQGRAKAFNNQTPAGKLWQFYNDVRYKNNTDYWLDEIQTSAEDFVWTWGRRRKP